MPKFFNTAGPCKAELHYMLPPEERLPGAFELIQRQLYFVVHAPRQAGKTTVFLHLAQTLTAAGDYAALVASCETGQTAGDDIEAGVMAVIRSIEDRARLHLPEPLRPPALRHADVAPESRLAQLLQRWAERCPRPLVLFLDEIDALMDASLISVLRQLRSGYIDRPRGFPHAMALIGLRDVRDYKMRAGAEHASLGTASPFNIKVESLTLRDFSVEEVAALCRQHSSETGQIFDPVAIERIWELTRGQPWLVNALASQVTWKDVPDRATSITTAHIEVAKEALIERRDTHLDSLVERLREQRVRRVIEPLLAGEDLSETVTEDDIRYTEDLGLVTARDQIRIANPIYQEVIPRALAWTTQVRLHQEPAWYVDDEGRLDVDGLLGAFAEFWREHAEPMLAAQPYAEAAPHLALLAFLQRVVNGGGSIQREYAVGMGRMDILIRWPTPRGEQREALEIKVWRDRRADPLERGLEQLAGYLRRLGVDSGTLVIFDRRSNAPPAAERTSLSEVIREGLRVRVLRA